MDKNIKNPDFQSRLLNGLTKYASKPLGFEKMFREEETLKKREVEYASSLPLQIILYFNAYFSIVWAIGTSFLWPILGFSSTEDTRVWIILILFSFILLVIFEIIRLYIGYVGNLSERVPELTGFWLLTLMIELPLSCFLIAIVWVPLGTGDIKLVIAEKIPMQFALQIFHTFFVFLEVIFGFIALRVLARYQISRFHYKQFEKYEDKVEKDQDWINDLDKNNHIKMQSFDFEEKKKY
ncbi:unnamed protein product [Brachionus calyciflorus]|uniref:Transmembrane protein 17 n=1 Tax=Brachionus calyciflorus TaxID=104777 RepID=A0A814RD21_9BILA|nr:unnamed protein product [Brachionus calyciflorus]